MEEDLELYARRKNIEFAILMGICLSLMVYGAVGCYVYSSGEMEAAGFSEESIKAIMGSACSVTMMVFGGFAGIFVLCTSSPVRVNKIVAEAVWTVGEHERKIDSLENELAELKSGRTEDHGNGR